MPKYEVFVEEELDAELVQIANAVDTSVEDLLHSFISEHLKDAKIQLIIKEYKDGRLKARDAWKLSGLSYQDFQNLANK